MSKHFAMQNILIINYLIFFLIGIQMQGHDNLNNMKRIFPDYKITIIFEVFLIQHIDHFLPFDSALQTFFILLTHDTKNLSRFHKGDMKLSLLKSNLQHHHRMRIDYLHKTQETEATHKSTNTNTN